MEGKTVEHTYGAELFNHNYPKQAMISFASAAIVMFLLFAYPLIRSFYDSSDDKSQIKVTAKRTINYSELSAPPPIDLERQETIMKAPPKVKVTKFLPPVAKKDEEVEEVVEVPTMEELENSQIGTVDNEGIDSVMYTGDAVEVTDVSPEEPLNYVEIMPEFVGGEAELFKYIYKTVVYPKIALDAGVKGVVIVQFVVEKDGSITDVNVVRGVSRALDREAKRVIEEMDNWIPGMQNGRKVRVLFTIPIRFSIVE